MSNRILSYRGLLASGGQDTILLSTKKGEIGYKIKKLQVIGGLPGTANAEYTVKIYSVQQTAVNATIDLSDNTLLGVAYHTDAASGQDGTDSTIIFGNMIFNQDIFVTLIDNQSSLAGNYYMELEVIKLSEDQAMVATLKNIRNND